MFGTKGFVENHVLIQLMIYAFRHILIQKKLLSDQLHFIHIFIHILGLSWIDVALKDAFTFYVYSKVSRYLTSTGRPIHYR